jgi:hypothetical protein
LTIVKYGERSRKASVIKAPTDVQEYNMRIAAFATIASLVLLATPVLAQTSNTTAGQPGDTSKSSQVPPDTAVTLDTQQRLKQSLEQSGFKNVLVLPEAYIIHAQAPDGSKIVMEVTPDQMQAVIERSGSSSPPSNSTTR